MSEQIIIGMSAKKQAGKNTCFNTLKLWRPDAQEFSFAEALKRVCIDVLGLEEWQAYGTDEQKNTLVPHLLWENFPIPCFTYENKIYLINELDGATLSGRYVYHAGICFCAKTGAMTAREVLQYWGTEIFRKQYHQVWADACIRKIIKSKCSLAVITDCRFPNEVAAVHDAGGRVIRLTRVVFPGDKHPSETALDAENFDHSQFDAILDNANMNREQQSEELYALMRRWNIVTPKTVQRMHA